MCAELLQLFGRRSNGCGVSPEDMQPHGNRCFVNIQCFEIPYLFEMFSGRTWDREQCIAFEDLLNHDLHGTQIGYAADMNIVFSELIKNGYGRATVIMWKNERYPLKILMRKRKNRQARENAGLDG